MAKVIAKAVRDDEVVASWIVGKKVSIPGVGSFPANWPWDKELPAGFVEAGLELQFQIPKPKGPALPVRPSLEDQKKKAIRQLEEAIDGKSRELTAVTPEKRDRYFIKAAIAHRAAEDEAARNLLENEASVRGVSLADFIALIKAKAAEADGNAIALESLEAAGTIALTAAETGTEVEAILQSALSDISAVGS